MLVKEEEREREREGLCIFVLVWLSYSRLKLALSYQRRCRNHTSAFFFETETNNLRDLFVERCPFFLETRNRNRNKKPFSGFSFKRKVSVRNKLGSEMFRNGIVLTSPTILVFQRQTRSWPTFLYFPIFIDQT